MHRRCMCIFGEHFHVPNSPLEMSEEVRRTLTSAITGNLVWYTLATILRSVDIRLDFGGESLVALIRVLGFDRRGFPRAGTGADADGGSALFGGSGVGGGGGGSGGGRGERSGCKLRPRAIASWVTATPVGSGNPKQRQPVHNPAMRSGCWGVVDLVRFKVYRQQCCGHLHDL